MQRHHLRTLAALYAHPLQHGVRVSKVEALLRALGAEVSELDGRRLKIVMPGGQETWIRLGCGIQSPDLDSEAMLRVRHLLQEAGVTAEHPEPEADRHVEDHGRDRDGRLLHSPPPFVSV